MKIAVIGASGWLGGTFAREALGRGQEVVAIGRDRAALESVEGALVAPADLDDPDSVLAAVSGSNVIVVAVTDRATPDRFRIPVTAAQLLDLAPRAGVWRLVFVGGGAARTSPRPARHGRPRLPRAPPGRGAGPGGGAADPSGGGRRRRLDLPQPAPPYLLPGEKTGTYRTQAGHDAVVNADGETSVTVGDLAAALVDELENGRYSGRRFTARS